MVNEERIPTDVIFGCAFPDTATAMFEEAMVPTMFEACREESACPVPVISPETARDERVPTDVILGWSAAETDNAKGTAPTTFDP
jgi:hypothetical protein